MDLSMRRPGAGDRRRKGGRRASGPPMKSGRRRTIDRDSPVYVRLSIEVKPSTRDSIKLASDLDSTVSSMREFVLKDVIPKTNRILASHGLGDKIIDINTI